MGRRSTIALSCLFVVLAMLANSRSALPVEHFLVRGNCVIHRRACNNNINKKPLFELSKVHLKVRYKSSEVRFVPCFFDHYALPQNFYSVSVISPGKYYCLLSNTHSTTSLRGPPVLPMPFSVAS
jgi:hypothetical protein